MTQLGFQLKEQGMSQALAHAEEIDSSWGEKAYQFVRGFAAQRIEFRTEEVRAFAEQRGLPAAPSARAWGGIIGRAVKSGLITSVRYVNCSNPSAHRCPVRVWQGI
jgi:hypothetical protein